MVIDSLSLSVSRITHKRGNRLSVIVCEQDNSAVLSVHNDLVYAIDNKHVSLLVLLDLSAAFDTVDHDILFPF